MNDGCDAIQNRLVKLHLTGIPITDDPEVKAHLTTCSTCRIYHDFLNHDHRELEVYAKSLDIYVDQVKQRLHRQIERAEPDSPSHASFGWWAVAAAVLGVAGLVFLFNGGPGAAPDRRGPDQNTTGTQSPTGQLSATQAKAVAMERQLARQAFNQGNTTDLLGLLSSDHHDTRILAAQYLSQIGDTNALPALEDLARTWDAPNRNNPYAEAIARIENHSLGPRVVTSEPARKTDPTPAATTGSPGRHINPDANGIQLEVAVTDKHTGLPIPEATIEVILSNNPNREGATDEHGVCRIGYEEPSREWADVRVRREGYVPMFVSMTKPTKEASPYRIDFALEPAAVIGGIVQDPNGEPLAGASVDFYYEDRVSKTQPFVAFDFNTTTDTQGRWQCNSMPKEIKQLDISASHPKYARTTVSGVNPMSPSLQENALEALRQKTFITTLGPGQSVEGMVTDMDGRPIDNATLLYENQDIQTDAKGRFVIARIPVDATWLDVIVLAQGFPRTVERISLPVESRPVEIVLDAGVTCHGRVVDANGLPLADVTVTADLTGTVHPLLWEVQTDANGLYDINDLPRHGVGLSFRKPGYMRFGMNLVAEGLLPEIALYPVMNVRGTVVDAEDGRPIESFRVIHGSYDKRHDKMHWEMNESHYEQTEGQLRSQFVEMHDGFALLIEADGYEFGESRMLLPGEQNVTLDFALVRGEGTQGVVLDGQGKPVSGAQVLAGYKNDPVTIEAGVPADDHQARQRTDTQGRFILEPQPGVQHVVAIDANGIGSVSLADFMASGAIVLEPWASVEGYLYLGTQPAVGHRMEAMQLDEEAFELGYYGATACVTDENGHFHFPKVPPGRMLLYHHEYAVGPGQHLQLQVGGKGRTVTGQFDVDLDQVVPWDSVLVRILDLNEPKEDAPVKPWHRFWPDKRGEFRYDNLEPGHYAMAISYTPDGLYRPQRQLCRLWHEFSVPPISDKRQLDIPIDLGTISLIPGDLEPGHPAPPFDLVLAGNRRVTSKEHKGKLVLLSFYRPEDLHVSAESLDTIKHIHARFNQESRFALIGMLSMDDKTLEEQAPLDPVTLPWPHALVGKASRNRTHIEYDVLSTPWPWNILIDPDGMVLAIGLEGDELVEAIETHLPE